MMRTRSPFMPERAGGGGVGGGARHCSPSVQQRRTDRGSASAHGFLNAVLADDGRNLSCSSARSRFRAPATWAGGRAPRVSGRGRRGESPRRSDAGHTLRDAVAPRRAL